MEEKIVYEKPVMAVVELTLENGVCIGVGSGGSEEMLSKETTFDESCFLEEEE